MLRTQHVWCISAVGPQIGKLDFVNSFTTYTSHAAAPSASDIASFSSQQQVGAGKRVAGRRVPARRDVEPEWPRRPGRGQPDLGRVEALEAGAVDTD